MQVGGSADTSAGRHADRRARWVGPAEWWSQLTDGEAEGMEGVLQSIELASSGLPRTVSEHHVSDGG